MLSFLFLSTCALACVSSSLETEIQQEMAELKGTQDPESNPSIEYLFVLSASNSYSRKFNPNKFIDLEDDFNRTQLAIHTAKKIAALRAHVKLEELNLEILRRCGPKVIYTGSEGQNKDLQHALDHSIQDYPKENFIFLNTPENEMNTKGQFLSIRQNFLLNNLCIGIITHAYHFPRVSRMLGENAPLYPFGNNIVIYAFLVDRQFLSPGIENRVQAEIKNIPIYIDKGDLAKDPAHDVIYLR